MCIGTSAAVGTAIAGIAGATGVIVAGKMGADAAHEGASATSDAAARAEKVAEAQLSENKRQFDLTQKNNWAQYLAHEQRMAPYRGLGVSATNTLSDMLHIPMANIAPPPNPDWGTAPTATTQTGQAPAPDVPQATTAGAPPPFAAPGGGQVYTSMPTLNSMLVAPLASMGPSAAGGVRQPAQMTSGAPPMVMMRAPNGRTQQVPANQVAHYQSKGATIVAASGQVT
jgi:hypothetical protein